MPRYDKKQLYIKRVLREVRRHSDDKWIDIKIEKELNERFGDRPVEEALADMPSPRLVGLNYRVQYADSAAQPDGFTPQTVRRLFRNFAAPAIELLAAFCVFRLFPTTEYAAYAICALAAMAAAIQQHVCFCKLKYVVIALAAPPFLLIWYPAKAAAAASSGFGEFMSALFSEGSRYALILILAFVIFYTVTAAFLHAYDYTDKPVKPTVMLVAAGIFLSAILGFWIYADTRNENFDILAAESLVELSAAYDEYSVTGKYAGLLSAAKSADSTVSRNFHSLSKMDAVYEDEFQKMVMLFNLCRRSQESGSCQELMDFFFSGYDENDTEKTLNKDAIFTTYEQVESRFELRLSSLESGDFSELHSLSQTASGLYAELFAVIDDCHTAWIFSENAQ